MLGKHKYKIVEVADRYDSFYRVYRRGWIFWKHIHSFSTFEAAKTYVQMFKYPDKSVWYF